LKYVFLENDGAKPVIISSSLSVNEETKLVEILKSNKEAIGWQLSDLKGISPSYCMHKIMMEEDFKPVAQPQRRFNPTMKDVTPRFPNNVNNTNNQSIQRKTGYHTTFKFNK